MSWAWVDARRDNNRVFRLRCRGFVLLLDLSGLAVEAGFDLLSDRGEGACLGGHIGQHQRQREGDAN